MSAPQHENPRLGRARAVAATLLAFVTTAAAALAATWALRAEADGDPTTDALPRVIPYEGTLALDGVPVDGPIDLRVRLYDGPDEGASQVFVEEHSAALGRAVDVASGRFYLALGRYADLAAPILDAEALWLALEVKAPGSSTWIALSGRQRIVPQAWSLWAASSTDMRVAGALTAASAELGVVRYEGTGSATFADDVIVEGDATVAGAVISPYVPPPGTIWMFDLAACPAGWSPLVAAQGRMIIGAVAPPDVAFLNGTPLGDLEDRTHTHTLDPGSVSTDIVAAHTHPFDAPSTTSSTVTDNGGWAGLFEDQQVSRSHSHTYDPSERTSGTGGNHSHTLDLPATTTSAASISRIMPYLQLLVCRRDG